MQDNATDEEKLCAKAFWHFICAGEFAVEIGKRIRIASINLDNEAHQCEVVHEIEVTKDMCSYLGVLNGTCSTCLSDTCCGASINMLGIRMGVDARGFTRSMEVVFSRPVLRGYTEDHINRDHPQQRAICAL
ncbi:hypothetical protein B0H19DRAFT_1261822 [Mycena capillaripes]|nr:hypothetical protein B0H19DRAFT_1261822 [Mycena capillaripes]